MKRNRRRGPLSAAEQQLVRENLGLVGLHLKRRLPGKNAGPAGSERLDLYQEGCLGLMQAAQDFDASSGIPFAAYALRRIHRAIGYALARRFSLVRVPACELRRARRDRRAQKRGASLDALANDVSLDRFSGGRRTGGLPSVVSGEFIAHLRDRACLASFASEGLPTIEERLRERYLHAVSDAALALASRPSPTRARARRHAKLGDDGSFSRVPRAGGRVDKNAKADELARRSPARPRGADQRAIIEVIVAERLTVSSLAWQTPLRQIADRLGCGYPVVAACEGRLIKEVEHRLRRDENLAALLGWAVRSPLGRRQPIDQEFERELRERSAAQFMRLLAEADDYGRSEILRKLLEIAGEALHPAICRTVSALPDEVRHQFLAEARATAAPRRKESHRQLTRRCA